jgi:hypothetical protein
MKKIFFLSLFLFSTLAIAQSEKEVEAAVENLRALLIDPTQKGLEDITTKELTYGHSSGLIENREEFVSALVSGKSDFKSVELSDQSITMQGTDVALVRHKLKGEIVDGEKVNPVNLGVLLVWVKENGTWKLAARQAFKI